MKVFFQFHRKFHLQWIEHEIQKMGEYSVHYDYERIHTNDDKLIKHISDLNCLYKFRKVDTVNVMD